MSRWCFGAGRFTVDLMAKGIIFLLLFLPVKTGLVASQREEYDEAVSLGTSCQAAWYLQGYGLRHWAYPFDWMVTPPHALLAFIKNKGKNFLEKENLQTLEVLPGTPSILHVVDTKYDIHLIHDFYFPDMKNYNSVKAKYTRRIKRFFNLLESNKRVLFIRVQFSRSEALLLDELLHKLYPDLKYTLLVLSDAPEAYDDWMLPRVKNFFMEQQPGNWMGDGERWREVLSLFSIKPHGQEQPKTEKW